MDLSSFARAAAKLGDGANAVGLQRRLRDLADAPDLADRQRIEDLLLVLLGDDDEAVGLPQVRGQLGEELVRGDADGGRQLGLLADLPL